MDTIFSVQTNVFSYACLTTPSKLSQVPPTEVLKLVVTTIRSGLCLAKGDNER